jgi:hypothetical protein
MKLPSLVLYHPTSDLDPARLLLVRQEQDRSGQPYVILVRSNRRGRLWTRPGHW